MITSATTIESTPEHADDPRVAHHFESAQQQFDAGKLGMWLFLVTEVLFFSGLFVAYAVYRRAHPEVFVEAHHYLNTTLGAFNTIVLLFSSLTMAWAVRSAQLGQRKQLVWLLAATLACASLFLGVKAVEYSHKWGEGLLWAGAYSDPAEHHLNVDKKTAHALLVLSLPAALSLVVSAVGYVISRRRQRKLSRRLWTSLLLASATFFVGVGVGQLVQHLATPMHAEPQPMAVHQDSDAVAATSKPLTGVFFSIYYAMTGVHAIHILAGMGVMVWLLRRSLRGDFGPGYFGPVDYVGLYWHLVDLVWIYLFPLLYLIR